MIEDEIQGTGAYDIIVGNDPEPYVELVSEVRKTRAYLDMEGLVQLRDSIVEMCLEYDLQ